MQLAERIKALCQARGITLNQLEKAIGLKSTISRWEDHDPSIGKVRLVAQYFGATVPDLPYCGACGWKQEKAPPVKHKRGNGQGSVYKLPSGKYKAVVILGYSRSEDRRTVKRTRSQVFERKKDALAALPSLRESPRQRERKSMTFWQVFEAWLPTHRAGKSTLDCYRSAVRYFGPLYSIPFPEVDVDDLQECLDDCPKGLSTKRAKRSRPP